MTRRKPVYPDAPFPVERLVVASGTLGASAHKNQHNPLLLDWDFYIAFKPIVLGEETYHMAMHVEIETKGIWQLHALAGMSRHDTRRHFNIGSFYVFDHRPSCDTRFQVHAVHGTKLDIEANLLVPPLRAVHVRTEVTFEGILVSSYGVQTKPDKENLMAVAGKLFDVSAFAPPRELPDNYGEGTLNLYFEPRGLPN